MKVFVFNPFNKYARFGCVLACILNQTAVTPPKRRKKSPVNPVILTPVRVNPVMIGYLHQDYRDLKKKANLTLFNDTDTFWFFGCKPDKSGWKGATLKTFDNPLLFLNALEQDLQVSFSSDTRRQAEDLAIFQILGTKGLKMLGRSRQDIREFKRSMED